MNRITFLSQVFILKYAEAIHFCGINAENICLVMQSYSFVMTVHQILRCDSNTILLDCVV